jgi:hypothetical protein
LATADAVAAAFWQRLSVFEQRDFLAELLRAAMRLGGADVRAWLDEQLGKPPLSVDLSGLTLTEADLAELMAEAARK